jgi:hypothetical protein
VAWLKRRFVAFWWRGGYLRANWGFKGDRHTFCCSFLFFCYIHICIVAGVGVDVGVSIIVPLIHRYTPPASPHLAVGNWISFGYDTIHAYRSFLARLLERVAHCNSRFHDGGQTIRWTRERI